MQLAIGDAIAISTMKYKNFGEKEFKNFTHLEVLVLN